MSLEIIVGDMFTETLGKDNIIICHGCNSQGVMGSGVAKIVRDLYPYAYLSYKQVERRHGLSLGQVIMSPPLNGEGPTIANCITQEYYGRANGRVYIDYEAIVTAMMSIAKVAGNKHVHLPLIGGGLGGGDARRLTTIFQAAFHNTKATLWLKEE